MTTCLQTLVQFSRCCKQLYNHQVMKLMNEVAVLCIPLDILSKEKGFADRSGYRVLKVFLIEMFSQPLFLLRLLLAFHTAVSHEHSTS